VARVVLYVETFLLLQKTWRAHAAVAIVRSRQELFTMVILQIMVQVWWLMDFLINIFTQWKDDGMETILLHMALMSGLSLICRNQWM
jgi:hypothetical protein